MTSSYCYSRHFVLDFTVAPCEGNIENVPIIKLGLVLTMCIEVKTLYEWAEFRNCPIS